MQTNLIEKWTQNNRFFYIIVTTTCKKEMAENREEKVGEESEKEEEYIIEDEFKMNKSAMKKENFVKTLSNRRVSFRLNFRL